VVIILTFPSIRVSPSAIIFSLVTHSSTPGFFLIFPQEFAIDTSPGIPSSSGI